MASLHEQAGRVVRRSWQNNPDAGFQEVASVLSIDTTPSTGRVAINLRSSTSPQRVYEGPSMESLGLPVLDLDAPIAADILRTDGVQGVETGNSKKVTKTRTFTNRSVLMGQVVSYQAGPQTYTVNLYPNLPGGSASEVIQVTGVVPLTPSGAGDQVPASRWILVARVANYQSTSTSFKERQVTVGVSNEITMTSEKHYFVNQSFLHDNETLPGTLTLTGTNKLFFRDADLYIQSGSDGNLDLSADDGINLSISGVIQVRVTNDNIIFNTGSDDPILSLAVDGQLGLTNGKLFIAEDFEVDGSARFDGIIDANSSLDVALTSDLHGTVRCYGTCRVDGALQHTGSTVGLYNVTPVSRQSNIGTITDSGGGTPGGSIGNAAPVGVVNETTLKDNFSTVVDRLNKIEAVLRLIGATT